MAKNVQFKCTIVRLTFKSNDTDFKIYAVHTPEGHVTTNSYGNVTILGNMTELHEGVEYLVKAVEEKGKYGIQYKVKSATRDKPISENGVRLFLSEILVESQVEELMKHYPNIIELIISGRDDEIDVNKLYNIKEIRMAGIKHKILENFMFAQIVEDFNGLIDFKVVKSLYEKYKDPELIKNAIRDNPYETLSLMGDIAFKTIDMMLLKFEKDLAKMENPPITFKEPLISCMSRLVSAMIHIIKQAEQDGNTKIKTSSLKRQVALIAKEAMDNFDEAIQLRTFVNVHEWTSLSSTFSKEVTIARKIKHMLSTPNLWDLNFEKTDMLTDEQWGVVESVGSNNVTILTAVGGTGKSFSTKVLVDVLDENEKTYCIISPTGRASKVIAGYTGRPASTIHRRLYSLVEDEKIDEDVVIIDEVSMSDVFVMSWLLCNISDTTKLLFIGDPAQLASIGAGNVLHDMINSKVIPTVTLTKIFRYGIGGITTCATKARLGEVFVSNEEGIQILGDDKGYVYYNTNSNKIAMQLLVKFYTKLLDNNAPEDIMVLSPFNVGDVGTKAINTILRPIANPRSALSSTEYMQLDEDKFYVGDLVIQKKNNYKSSVFINSSFDTYDSAYESKYYREDNKTFISNGDVGKIEFVSEKLCIINFDGERIVYDKFDMGTCLLSYSQSVHASQGGSAKNVILFTMPSHERMLNSNLIYVGQTRAREKVIHIGSFETIAQSVRVKAELDRDTHLRFLLEGDTDA